MPKLDPNIATIGIAGVLAIAIGYFVNAAPWSASGKPGAMTLDVAHAQSAGTPKPQWAASATGRVEPKDGEVRVASQMPGRIVEIAGKTNDRVSSGDVLVRLDDSDLWPKVVAASAEVQVRVRERDEEKVTGTVMERHKAEDTVSDSERAVFAAQKALDEALINTRSGRSSVDDVTAARTSLAAATGKLEADEASLAKINAKEGMPLPTRLESGLTIARAELTSAEKAIERTRIRAPFDGTVLNMLAKMGETVVPTPDSALFVFGDLSGLRIRAEVEERDATKVHVGQRVIVRADAFPEKDFEGQVTSIASSLGPPRITTRGPRRPNDVEVLEVMVGLDGLPPLLTGMRVDVFFRFDATAGSDSTAVAKPN